MGAVVESYSGILYQKAIQRIDELSNKLINPNNMNTLFLSEEIYVILNNLHHSTVYLNKLLTEMEQIQKLLTKNELHDSLPYFEQTFQKINQQIEEIITHIVKIVKKKKFFIINFFYFFFTLFFNFIYATFSFF